MPTEAELHDRVIAAQTTHEIRSAVEIRLALGTMGRVCKAMMSFHHPDLVKGLDAPSALRFMGVPIVGCDECAERTVTAHNVPVNTLTMFVEMFGADITAEDDTSSWRMGSRAGENPRAIYSIDSGRYVKTCASQDEAEEKVIAHNRAVTPGVGRR